MHCILALNVSWIIRINLDHNEPVAENEMNGVYFIANHNESYTDHIFKLAIVSTLINNFSLGDINDDQINPGLVCFFCCSFNGVCVCRPGWQVQW